MRWDSLVVNHDWPGGCHLTEQYNSYDIAVVGGGMVGAAAALGFAHQGRNVVLVEAFAAPPEFNAGIIDNRVSAITRASQSLLDDLDAWTLITAMRCCPYEQMHVWDAGGEGQIHFDAAELGEPSLGAIIENSVIQSALWQRLQESKSVTLLTGARVTEVHRAAGQSKLSLDDGRSLQAELVVVADGKQSPLRDMLGIGTRGWAYDQHALVATVSTGLGHRSTAWQRFMPNGPLAFLPLCTDKDKTCSIVWSTSPQQAELLRDMADGEFLQALTDASEGQLGDITAVDSRAVFPLELKHAVDYISEGFVLIGDAAHAIHPLAGQGVNLGFEDVHALLDIVDDAYAAGRQPGGLHTLRKYERQRKGANLTMLGAMDVFKRLFSNSNRPLSLLRNTGLSLVDRAGPVKHFLTRYAMGLD